ncbi:MAG: prolyl oligopeptidase family serine peptidase, partial [Acidimicrobiia bacterium]
VRTLVHEYGGGDVTYHDGVVFFSNFADQRLYRQPLGEAPEPITPESDRPGAVRYADHDVALDGRRLYCVRETHGSKVVNEVVVLPTQVDGHVPFPIVVATGHDFYAAPRLSRDGRVCWLTWDHPRMPWDGTELWVADLLNDGTAGEPELVAGGPEESILEPTWLADGTLLYISDRSGWWNWYGWRDSEVRPVAIGEAEFGYTPWLFGARTLVPLPDGRLACTWRSGGRQHLGLVASGSPMPAQLDLPFTWYGQRLDLASDGRLLAAAASPVAGFRVVAINLDTGIVEAISPEEEDPVARRYVSVAHAIEFPTAGGHTAHALYYPPTNPDVTGPPGELPPLLVLSHGGPTSATVPAFNRAVQYWTTRGLAVVDVNYGGSTGYGRSYRGRLEGRWGVVDVADCINAARWLADRQMVDRDRLAIRGGSAGGYTTLCALTFHDVFAAGASYFGVADAEALARDTHKFEARYLDSLIGPYPEKADIYRERSPINFTERLSAPMIIFQGLEDEVVPPSQAEVMVAALRERGLTFAYLPFEGEQHGFRRAENIVRAAEAEYAFYAHVLGFRPADPIEPIPLENA